MAPAEPSPQELIRRCYAAFNARDLDAALALAHPDVDWPNALEGGRLHGHAAVRAYWEAQFAAIDPHVEPEAFAADAQGRVVVDVHQVVRDRAGALLADERVRHVYTLDEGLIVRMDIRPAPAAVRAVPVGTVESPLTDAATAPKQGDEGAPAAWLVLHEELAAALEGLAPGDEILVLTWLDRARRDVLRVHPRGDPTRAEQGVFATRSPDRPNPIGLHRATILAIEGARVRVRPLEALDGTPVLDIKPVLRAHVAER